MPRFTACLTPRFLAPHEVTPETFDVIVPIATVTAPDLRAAHSALADTVDDYITQHSVSMPAGLVFVQDDDAIVASILVCKTPKNTRFSPGYSVN